MSVLEGKNARQKLKNDNGRDLDRAQRYVIFRRPTLGVKFKKMGNSELDNIRIKGLNVRFVGMPVFRRERETRQMLPKTRQLCREFLNPFFSCVSRQIGVGFNLYGS